MPAGALTYLGGADDRNARRTVLRSRLVRRAISLIESPKWPASCIRVIE